jgi:hypothetical protein
MAIALATGAATGTSCGPGTLYVGAEVTPRMVWVSPGIWVVENQPYAVYYADGFYWRHAGGYWYRSSYYDGGFVQVGVGFVPRIVIGAYRPVHVRYRAPVQVHSRPVIRDHRRRR